MNPTTPTIGDGTRILHFLVDTIIVSILAYLVYGWWNFYVMYWDFTPIRFGPFFFMTMWAYLFLFEFIFLRTPAKWFTGTKVVNEKGGRPNIFQIFLRTTILNKLRSSLFPLGSPTIPVAPPTKATGL